MKTVSETWSEVNVGMKNVTIYDIAQEAGVSPATVSRVLTNSANVSSEKKQKIQAIIDKYNFTPNALARGLSDNKRKVIGILTSDIRNPFYASLFVECEKAANERGYTVILSNSLNDNEAEEQHILGFLEQRVDAVIQIGGRVDELVSDPNYVELVNRISNSIPVVITGKLDGSDCYQVNIDQVQSMELVMEYLYNLGHRKIALIGGRRNVKSTLEKQQRYKQLLSKWGIPFREEYLIEGPQYNEKSGYSCMQSLLSLNDIPTAVIAINDFAAIGALRAAVDHNKIIPEDISLISFDDTFIAMVSTPQLTSVNYDYERFGQTLIETAIKVIEKEEVPRVQLVNSVLSIRNSCQQIIEE